MKKGNTNAEKLQFFDDFLDKQFFVPVSFPEVTDNVLQVFSDLVGSLTQKPNL